jgi:hypothetical protein
MHRIFLGLAITNGTMLLASFVFGFVAGGEIRPAHYWRDVHFLLGLLTGVLTLMVHSIVFTYFLGTGKWVKEVVRVYQLPEWVSGQADRNKRRAFPFEMTSMALICGTVWLGAASDTREFDSVWHLGLAAMTLAWNLVAYVLEYASIVAQARLLLEVKDQADRLRAAQGQATHSGSD